MPPKKKQTKRKPEEVEPVAANKEVKQNEAEEKIYFEPRYLSDVEVVYNGVAFHVHKVMLISKSEYFKNIFEGDKKCKRIVLQSLKEPIYGEAIVWGDLERLFTLIYRNTPLEENDYICSPECWDTDEGDETPHSCKTLDPLILAFLFHNFQMEVYEKTLSKILVNRQTNLKNFSYLIFLAMCCHYNWNDQQDEFIDAAAQVKEFWTKTEYWKVIPADVKELVYQWKIRQY